MNQKSWILTATFAVSFLTSSAQQIDMNAVVPETVKPIIGDKQYLPSREGYIYWTQYSPFNNYCPEKDGQRAATGCVATSMAMVMSAHKYPTQGQGSVSYLWNGQTLSRDFSQSNYRWDLLKYRYWQLGQDYNENEADAIATLLRDCGYAVEMIYGVGYDGSGAPEEKACKALVNNFKYDRSVAYLCRDYCSTEYWEKMLRIEIAAGRPVMYGGGSTMGAHEFVCDGYNADGKFFFHLGATGIDDYYGTLDEGLTYTSGQTAIYRIMPSGSPHATGIASMVAGCNCNFFWEGDNKISANVRFFTPVDAIMVDLAVAVENRSTHDVNYVNQRTFTTSNVNNQGTCVKDFNVSGSFADGVYDLYPVYRRHGEHEWEKVLFGDYCQEKVTMTVKGNAQTFSNDNISEVIDAGKYKINGIIYKLNDERTAATVTFQNASYDSYSGNVIIPEEIEIENSKYPVTRIGEQAFSLCTKLNSVVIPNTVTDIDFGAFYKCSATSVTFAPNSSLQTIGVYAFQNSSITSIVLPESLRNLHSEAFVSCYSLTNVVLPANLSYFSKSAFSTCISLCDVTCYATIPYAFSGSDTPFTNLQDYDYDRITLRVPQGCVEIYRSSNAWNRFVHIEEINGEDINTGINNYGTESKNDIYDVSGRKVLWPSQGLYIRNGKKIYGM